MKKEIRSELLQFRVTAEEKRRIIRSAIESNFEIADYLRAVALRGTTFKVQVNEPKEKVLQVESIRIEKADEVGEKQRKHGTG